MRKGLVCLAAILCLAPLAAQSDRGTITGRILDPSGAAVPGASVAAASLDTGIRYVAKSNEAGNYVIRQLPVGSYEVSVAAAGFRRFVQRGIEINVAQTVTLDLSLEVGQVEQTLEVTANAALLEASTSDVGTVISRERIMDLPLSVSGNMRNPEAFIFLAPGVTGDAANTQINGSQSRAKEVLLDGAGSTSPESGGILFTYPSVEAIGEFKLVSSNYSAEFGRTGGGFEVFTTKSGTNQLHGSLFDYFRNDVFDARGFYPARTPVNRQNEFGAVLGGPVLIPKLYNGKNRSFFHFVYSGFRYRAGATNQLLSVPPEDFRRGDFTRAGRPIYDPATTRAEGGRTLRTQFPGNVIPQSRFSQVSRNMLAVLPAPTNSGVLNNFLSVGARRFTRDQVNVKFDHSFSDRSRFSAFTYIGTQNNVDAEGLPSPLSAALNRDYRSRWVRLNHDFILSAASLNSFRAGFTREGEFWRKLSVNQDWPSKLGLKGVNTGAGNVFPLVTFTDGFTGWANEQKSAGAQVNNTFQVSDTLSHIRGNHSLKFGVDARWLQTNGVDPFLNQGRFDFNALGTGLPGTAASGNGFASFLLGSVHRGEQNILAYAPANRYSYAAFFVQDDWKATRRLTLNLGLRYDIYFPRREKNNNLSSFDPELPNPGAGGRPGAVAFLGEGPGRSGRVRFSDIYYRNFGPRFGFAFQANAATVLRGGYGIYFAPGNATAGLRWSQGLTFGFSSRPTPTTPDNGITPAFNWDNGFPPSPIVPPVISPTVANGFDVNYMGRTDGRPPYFQSFTFGIQRELPSRLLVEVSYVGNKGTRLGTNLISLNQVDPRYLTLGSLLTRPFDSAEARAAGITSPYEGFRGTVAQALRPFPQYNTISNRSNPNGNSTYHALQVEAEKRFTRGLTFLANYTWSKTISDGDVQAGGGPGGQTFYNRSLEKAISTNDVPHIVNLSYIYELPFGRGKKWLNEGFAARIAGGWSLTGIHQYAGGKPIALTANNTLPLFNSVLRPDAVAGVERKNHWDRFDPNRDRYINPAAFAVPAPFRFGTSARAYTDLRSPSFYNESFGAIKRTALRENFILTFRAEFFNAFNRVVFSGPAANASNSNFGRISGQSNPARQGQLALRLEF